MTACASPEEMDWRHPPAQVRVSRDVVHIWRASLDVTHNALTRLRATLAPDELARAEGLRFPVDQHRFMAARGTLRAILGLHLDMDPAVLQFVYGPRGRPALRQAATAPPEAVAFNLSHSHGLALYAVTRGRNVGIDVELVRAGVDDQLIAEDNFSPGEAALLRTLPASARTLAFLQCWTRKEALAKARGEGLSLLRNRFEASPKPDQPPAPMRVPGEPGHAALWSVRALDPGPGFVASLAVEGEGWCLNTWSW